MPACSNTPTAAILFDAPNTEVINGHCEGFLNCILMGANNAPGSPSGSIGASSQKVSAVAGGPSCPSTCNVVHISNNYLNNSDYVIQNVRRNGFSNNIKDDVNGVSVGNLAAHNDPFTALYSWASGVNNTPSTSITNILTTDPSTPNQFGSGVTAATYGTHFELRQCFGELRVGYGGQSVNRTRQFRGHGLDEGRHCEQRDQDSVRRATFGSRNVPHGG